VERRDGRCGWCESYYFDQARKDWLEHVCEESSEEEVTNLDG
jgi:hypothetical protein